MELGLKYNYYAKKNTEEFKKKIYNQMNWEYDEKDLKSAHRDIHLILKKKKNGTQQVNIYKSAEYSSVVNVMTVK